MNTSSEVLTHVQVPGVVCNRSTQLHVLHAAELASLLQVDGDRLVVFGSGGDE